ncbi:MAG: hypothetical protein K6G00_03920 [Treponema sp.]|nr:hypothetical protein [Treponema sp.]
MKIKENIIESLKLVIYYTCLCIFLCVCSSVLYMIYTLCQNLVAGQNLSFDFNLFMEGFFLFTPVVFIFGAMFMTFFFIRHPYHYVMPIICYCVLYVISWLFIIPSVSKINTSSYETYIEAKTKDMPSSGYFRRNEDKILYYSSVSESDNSVTGLCIDSSLVKNNVYTFSSLKMSHKKTAFTDSLIQNSIDMPPVIAITAQKLLELSLVLRKCASQAFGGRRSFSYWLCFATMGLALLGVIGLRNVSRWRLVNMLFVAVTTLAIIVGNTLGYVNPIMVGIEKSFNDVFSKVCIFKSLCSVGNPFIMFCNIFVFIVLAALFFIFEKNSRTLEDL